MFSHSTRRHVTDMVECACVSDSSTHTRTRGLLRLLVIEMHKTAENDGSQVEPHLMSLQA